MKEMVWCNIIEQKDWKWNGTIEWWSRDWKWNCTICDKKKWNDTIEWSNSLIE